MPLNHTELQGRMVADPELREMSAGAKVANFRVAWSEKIKERENILFLDCKAYSGTAEFICNYFKKGQEIILEGKMNTDEWTSQDGQKRSKVVLVIERAHFSGKKADNGTAEPSEPAAPEPTPVEVGNDGLPF